MPVCRPGCSRVDTLFCEPSETPEALRASPATSRAEKTSPGRGQGVHVKHTYSETHVPSPAAVYIASMTALR